ncbi:BEL1-like homeodomain protein 8 [Beta vulgaris subsp. vulgaris]|uniref:BEL1-like homeodomain protein 8 n=1 Tax=Beta vulgaris subsp. vulgaris TaxID=3555 RepID=UPI002036BB83|nr:BEL1-like homeodomain protein 8 [Beta vulgaris subsp. vulgaris]
MEMSNDFFPELHVAQQRRRDKLRVQHLEELQANNFHNHNTSPMVLVPPDMLNFTGSQSSSPFPNIHPTRFIAPASSDPCENWVPNYNGNETSHVEHDGSRRHHLSSIMLPQFLAHHNETSEINYQNNVQSWGNGGNELPLLPGNFVSQPNNVIDASSQSHVLSLSLSSNQICEYQHLGDPRELKPLESGSIASVVKQSMSNSGNNNKLECGNNLVQDVAGSSILVHRNVGPLGPFTGYASILKSSKFLKPAQLLLDEFFGAAGLWRGGEEAEVRDMAECSSAVASKIRESNDLSARNSSCESYRPDCHERKAKLLHMQEEVCKRQKQYHQQMQMVISAFDSVPGLSNATPYISRSLKTISRHFRCLKNAIADQLKHIKRALGEDLSSPTSFLKGDSSSSMRYDQSFTKVKSGACGGTGHVGHQSHVWRPQRGLPERAVSILRAWLFDHFLHPYPTDNDKQMLATQTGLTRNQVSNWFINARVRLWKPMVEEIHTLETKGSSRSELNSNNSVMSVIAKNQQAAVANEPDCKLPQNLACDKQLVPSSSLERSRGDTKTEHLFQKCSRIENNHQVPSNMDSSYIDFLPYQRWRLEQGGIGAVSLTLGLRHGSETTNPQLQHQFLPQGPRDAFWRSCYS